MTEDRNGVVTFTARKTKKGKKYQVKFKLSAKGAESLTRAVKVKINQTRR